MPDAPGARRGLEPVPGRLPRLPGRVDAAGPLTGTAPPLPVADAPPRLPPPPDRSHPPRPAALRPREFQLDRASRSWVDSTALSVRLRTERAFDGSMLVRGILRALQRSGLELPDHCATEDDVADFLAARIRAEGR